MGLKKWVETSIIIQRRKGNNKPEEVLRAELTEAYRRQRRRQDDIKKTVKSLRVRDPISSDGALREIAKRLLNVNKEKDDAEHVDREGR